MGLRAIKCIFVGYSLTQKGYKCYHLSSNFYFCFFLSQLMLLSMKVSLIFPVLIFRGRIPLRKIKDRDSCFIDPFFTPKVFDQYLYLSLIVLTLLKCLIQYLYPPLNPSHPSYPSSLLLRIKLLANCIQGRKLQFFDLYKSKNPNRLLEMR